MIRESPDPSSAMVILDVRPDGSIEFMARNAFGAATTFIAGASAPSNPVWLKLARSGSTITGFMSADGSTWTEVGSASPSIESMALIGIVVTSHRRGALATAGFDHLSQ
jgi:regulation of enolase protein 1 (concanavalin A-like superfamily)